MQEETKQMPSKYHDAILINSNQGPSEEFLNHPIRISKGSKRNASKWPLAEGASIKHLLDKLTVHLAGKKDGPAILQGYTPTGERNSSAMTELSLLGIDVDCGLPVQQVVDRVVDLGLFAVVHTTHSHLSTTSEISEDRFLQFVRKHDLPDEPTPDALTRFLREEKQYLNDIAITAESAGVIEGRRAMLVQHAPMPRCRIIFPLSRPYVFGEQRKNVKGTVRRLTHREAQERWRGKCTAIANMLRFPIDESCKDAARLFYLPRHPADAEEWASYVIGGTPLDLDSIEERTADTQRSSKGSQSGDRFILPSERDLREWAAKHGETFQPTFVFDEYSPERIRGDRASGKATVECPHDHDHSNPSDVSDAGCYVQDANTEDREGGFIWHCSHNSCKSAGRDRLDRLKAAIEAGWFPEDVLDDPAFHAELAEDDLRRDPEQIVTEFKERVAGWSADVGIEDIERLARDAATAKIGRLRTADLVSAVSKKIKRSVPKKDLERLFKDSAGEAAAADGDKRDWLPDGFAVRDGNILFDGADVCPYFEPVTWLRTPHNDDYRLLIAFQNSGGTERAAIAMADVQAHPEGVRAELAHKGFSVTPGMTTEFNRLLVKANIGKHARLASKPGFLGNAFVLPDGNFIAADDSEAVFLTDKRGDQVAGTEDAQIAAFQLSFDVGLKEAAPRFAIGALAGSCGCLVDFLDLESNPIVAFTGRSSRGKTSTLEIAASCFGNPLEGKGNLHKLRATANAMELLAERANGTFLGADEPGSASKRQFDIEEIVFMLADGVSKPRSRFGDSLRTIRTWRTMIGMASEVGLSDLVKRTGTTANNGFIVRAADIDISIEPEIPLTTYNRIMAVRQNFGHVGALVAQYLLDNETPDELRERIEDKTTRLAGEGADAFTRRSAFIFGLLWECGEIYKACGVARTEHDFEQIVRGVWDRYKASPESNGLDPSAKAARTLQDQLFRRMNVDVVDLANADERQVKTPVAWFEEDKAKEHVTFYVPTDQLSELASTPLKPSALASYLKDRGALTVRSETKKAYAHEYVPTIRRTVPHYRLTYSIAESEQAATVIETNAGTLAPNVVPLERRRAAKESAA